MPNAKRYRKYVGKPIVFMGFDDKFYDGFVSDCWCLGIIVKYGIPGVGESKAWLKASDIKDRIVIQM